MITERREDIIQVEIESRIKIMLEKYTKAFLADRFGEVADGNLYAQAGGQPPGDSQAIRGDVRLAPGSEPGG